MKVKAQLSLKMIGYFMIATIFLDGALNASLMWKEHLKGVSLVRSFNYHGSMFAPIVTYLLLCVVSIFKSYKWVNFSLLWILIFYIFNVYFIYKIVYFYDRNSEYQTVVDLGIQSLIILSLLVHFTTILFQKIAEVRSQGEGFTLLFPSVCRLTYVLTCFVSAHLVLSMVWKTIFYPEWVAGLIQHLEQYLATLILSGVGIFAIQQQKSWTKVFHPLAWVFFFYHSYITLERIGVVTFFIRYDAFMLFEALLVVLIPMQSYFEFRGPTSPQQSVL